MKFSVWWIWACGLLLTASSFYAICLLPSIREQWSTPLSSPDKLSSTIVPSVVVFSAPAVFSGSAGTRQSLAIQSWLGLSTKLKVVLFSQHHSVAQFAAAYVSRVILDSSIDFTFLGTPFFHSMVERSRFYSGDISVFVDPKTVLFPDLVSTLSFTHTLDHGWLLVASSKDTSYLPLQIDDAKRHWLKENSHAFELQDMLRLSLPRNKCDDSILLAWNNKHSPLHKSVLPPFLFLNGFHNRWVVHEAMMSGFRLVFDASWTISSFSLRLSRDPNGDREDFIDSDSDHQWERAANGHLASTYGSLQDLNNSSIAKLLRCRGQYMFIDGQEENSNQMTTSCIAKYKSVIKKPFSCLETSPHSFEQPSLPFSLERLASIVADSDKTVVLSVAGYSYRDMLMSWVCTLRHLHVTNFLVCALDLETYTFSILQGLPVFYDQSAPKNISYDACHFGTKCFQRVTKVKSRMVLKLLQLGYNVLLSDVDVYWFSNPLPFLKSFGPAVLVAQSDEYSLKGPVNLPRRLNSGFYFCRSDIPTIVAMGTVVKHAERSKLSEQPSFYDTLCGVNGSKRVGHNLCVDRKTNLTVHFLDRNLFPNGASHRIWDSKDVRARCRKLGCRILHNNWISGRSRKLERQILAGLWDYDESKRMCLQRNAV